MVENKYHRWLEVQIFICWNEKFESQNRVEALKQERGLAEVTKRSSQMMAHRK